MKNFLKNHKILSWIIGLLGALTIGAVGSGIWELVLKPSLTFLGNGVINFLVSQSTSFSNEIYQSISMRSLDRFQAKAYSLIVTATGFVSILLWYVLLLKVKTRLNKKEFANKDRDEIKEQNRVWILKSHKNFNIFMALYFLVVCIPFFTYTYDGFKTNFIAEKVIAFEYLLKVNSDVLSDIELKRLESQFAQIKNAEDYQKIILNLKKHAEKNNKHVNTNPL